VSKPRTEYLNKELAAKRTGLSVRRLLELANRGRIQKRLVFDPISKRKIAVFCRHDLDALRSPAGAALQISGPDANDARPIAALHHPPQMGVDGRSWLTLAEAETFIGLPEAFLAAQIRAGKLAALDVGVRPGGRWRVSKRDLEAIAGERHPATV